MTWIIQVQGKGFSSLANPKSTRRLGSVTCITRHDWASIAGGTACSPVALVLGGARVVTDGIGHDPKREERGIDGRTQPEREADERVGNAFEIGPYWILRVCVC